VKFIFFFISALFIQLSYAQSDVSQELAQPPESTDINLQGQVPRIEFESTKFNFGDIYRGSVVTHSFSFQNTGNGILILNSLHAACGCINTKVYAKDGTTAQNTFKPNESGVVRVDFDTSQFAGNVVRSITAETNMGSSSPTVTLTLTANIFQELFASPALLYIGKIDKNVEKTFNINVNFLARANVNSFPNSVDYSQNLLDQITKSTIAMPFKNKILNNSNPLEIVAVESSIPAIEAKLQSTSNTKVNELQVKVGSSLPIGPLNAKLIVWNNSTFYKNFQIPIVGEVVGRVDSSAKYVEFGVVSELKTSERVITYSSSVKNFAITSVKINLRRLPEMKDLRDSDIFEIKKEKLKSPATFDPDSSVAYKLHFKLIYPKKLNPSQSLENSSGVNVSGNFLVKTNDPDYKEISVPFFGVLRKGP